MANNQIINIFEKDTEWLKIRISNGNIDIINAKSPNPIDIIRLSINSPSHLFLHRHKCERQYINICTGITINAVSPASEIFPTTTNDINNGDIKSNTNHKYDNLFALYLFSRSIQTQKNGIRNP